MSVDKALELIPRTGGQDYKLRKGRECWIVVNGYSIWIRRDGKQGVMVQAFIAGKEASTEAIDHMIL